MFGTEELAFLLGGLLVLIGLLGGGLEIRELKIPPVSNTSRLLAFIVGIAFTFMAFIFHINAGPSGNAANSNSDTGVQMERTENPDPGPSGNADNADDDTGGETESGENPE